MSNRRRSVKWTQLAAASLLAAPALAQNPPAFNPASGDPSATSAPAPAAVRGGGYWLPGQPIPTGGQNSANNPLNPEGGMRPEGARAPQSPPGSLRGTGEAVVRPEDLVSSGLTVDDPHAGDPNNAPEMHLVRKGDTLWDISSAYFRNPWYWPRLWALNPVITNPHWIYPGDQIRLRSPDGGPAIPGGPPVSATQPMKITRDGVVERGIHLRATGFVEPGELKASARIVGSKEEKIMLAALDETYIEWSGDKKPRVGERLSIYKVEREVKRPGTKDVMGSIVSIIGEMEIRSVGDNHIARGLIVEANDPVERDFRVGPLKRRYDVVEAVPDKTDVNALVMAALMPRELMGEAMLVFLDRGKDDGLAIGNRLMVVRRGDGYEERMKRHATDDPRFPREVMGEVLVVDVRGKTSTGLVMRSTKEVEVGDHLEARKGY